MAAKTMELQHRAQAFLQRAIPPGIDYAPDSIAERFIATYARRGHLPDNAATADLLELACLETSAMIDQLPDPMAREYFEESLALLEAIGPEGR